MLTEAHILNVYVVAPHPSFMLPLLLPSPSAPAAASAAAALIGCGLKPIKMQWQQDGATWVTLLAHCTLQAPMLPVQSQPSTLQGEPCATT